MFATALLPVSLHESTGRLGAMLAFLHKFDTHRVVLLHVTTGVPGTATEEAVGDLRDGAIAAAREAIGAQTGARGFRSQPFTPHSDAESPDSAIGVEMLVKSGSPALEITRTAWEVGAAFIYLPYKRKSWIQQTLVGSTTKDVIRLTSLPVFVFRQRLSSSPDDPLRILYPTAFGDTDREAIPYLEYPGLAAHQLILLHVRERAPDPVAERRQRELCDANLERLSGEVAGNYAEVSSIQMVGNPRRVIPRLARRENAGLLIAGKSERPGGLSAVMGSVAGELAKSAPCSVFILSRSGAAGLSEGASR